MRIFYGVQGTGNGHITRARIMAKELLRAGIQVDFQFTGRDFNQYFDMAIFGNYQLRQGMTLAVKNGQMNYFKTVVNSKPLTFIRDVKALDLTSYDVVLSDFEPVSAWAGKLQGVPVVGIGHQYAFKHKIPKKGTDPLASLVLKGFAPVDIGIGLHWHHFGQPILPPIIETHNPHTPSIKNKIVVYLPFEDSSAVLRCLSSFKDAQFHVYTPDHPPSSETVICKPLSREGFQKDLRECSGVICNSGFELVSEALQLGKKILVKPIHAHMEQISNATALHQLHYGYVMNDLDPTVIYHWLHKGMAVQVNYPNTAKILVDWLLNDMPTMTPDYIDNIWRGVKQTQLQLDDELNHTLSPSF